MMEVFGLVEKEYSSIKGVAMEPFVFSGSRTFTLFRDIQLTQRTRWEQSSGCCHPHPQPQAMCMVVEGHFGEE